MDNLEQSSNEEFLNSEASDNGQALQNTVREEDYKSLQAEYTRANQEKINLAVKLATKDKKSIIEISDRKLQDKVIKEIYWLNNIDEVKLIHWNTFYNETAQEEDDDDKFSKLERELKIMKYNQTKGELERFIEDYKKENKILFEWADAEDRLRDEIKYVSSELTAEERVKRAAKIAFGITNNPNDAAYLKLIQSQNFVKWWEELNKEEKTKIQDEISSIFRKKIK